MTQWTFFARNLQFAGCDCRDELHASDEQEVPIDLLRKLFAQVLRDEIVPRIPGVGDGVRGQASVRDVHPHDSPRASRGIDAALSTPKAPRTHLRLHVSHRRRRPRALAALNLFQRVRHLSPKNMAWTKSVATNGRQYTGTVLPVLHYAAQCGQATIIQFLHAV